MKLTLNIGLEPSAEYNHDTPMWRVVQEELDKLFVKYKMRLAISSTEPTLVIKGVTRTLLRSDLYDKLRSLVILCGQECIAVHAENELDYTGKVHFYEDDSVLHLIGEHAAKWGQPDPSLFIEWKA
jgi:hypothetical protein